VACKALALISVRPVELNTISDGKVFMNEPGRNCQKMNIPAAQVSVMNITQATGATFEGIHFKQPFLFFIQSGTKRVICPINGELVVEAGDLIIFPAGSVVTMENRPIHNARYQAVAMCFEPALVDKVFSGQAKRNSPGIQVLRADPHRPFEVLTLIVETLTRQDLPSAIRQHRLLEPLVWLFDQGIRLPEWQEETPWVKVGRLIEADLSRHWRATEVAEHFAMSEATFRRWLAKSGPGFAQILLNARLERGLSMLQTGDTPISEIAFECGFKTPSHFSASFRKRFGIAPRMIRYSGE
jgi:AraC-like DNA-binding protein